jgi:hypothetical protein
VIRDIVLTGLAALLALVLLGAGGAKLADLGGFATSLVRLGLPEPWSRPAARLVAAAEVGVGGLSLAGVAPGLVSVLVLGLTVGFVATAGYAARWRPEVRCRCFGALSESRFGRTSVLRSALLAVAAGVVVAAGDARGGGPHGAVETVLLLGLAVLFSVACAAAANAVDLMRRGATSR